MENVNKIAGPFVEAWAGELFESIASSPNNQWGLIHVESCKRLDMADVILQFKHKGRLGNKCIWPPANIRLRTGCNWQIRTDG